MGTGQMMLTIGAMILLSTIILTMNNSYLATNNSLMNEKLSIVAMSIAQSKVNEIKSKNFDENVGKRDNPGLFTSTGLLGPESGEAPEDFDDVDDYNYYSGWKGTESIYGIPYEYDIQVRYVDVANNGVVAASGTQTFKKEITVLVRSEFMTNQFDESKPYFLELRHIASYVNR